MSRSFPFKREFRVRKSSEFKQIFTGGARRRFHFFTVFYRLSPSGESRLGISVSSRYGNAVLRNSVKRVVREGYRLNRPSLVRPLDIVLSLSRKAEDLASYRSDIERIFQWFKSQAE